MTRKTALVLVMLTLFIPSLARAADSRLRLEILVDGHPLPQLEARGATYVEALRGREFSVRIENLDSRRVGVALSVDGRNTIDATHASARDARKWILDAGESIVLDGWQVSGSQARHFFFTTEDRSYAAWLGDVSNAGVIEAVAFRERPTEAVTFSTGSYVVFPDGTQDASRERVHGRILPVAVSVEGTDEPARRAGEEADGAAAGASGPLGLRDVRRLEPRRRRVRLAPRRAALDVVLQASLARLAAK